MLSRQEHHQPLETLDRVAGKVQDQAEILERGKTIQTISDGDDPQRERMIDAGETGERTGGCIVDVDDFAVECPAYVWATNPSFDRELRVLPGEPQGSLPARKALFGYAQTRIIDSNET